MSLGSIVAFRCFAQTFSHSAGGLRNHVILPLTIACHDGRWTASICIFSRMEIFFFFFKFIILLTLRYRFPNLRSFSFITIDIINFFCQIYLLRDNQQKKHFIKWTLQSTPLYLLPKPLVFDNIYQYRVNLDTLFTMKFSSYSLKRMYFPPTFN